MTRFELYNNIKQKMFKIQDFFLYYSAILHLILVYINFLILF